MYERYIYAEVVILLSSGLCFLGMFKDLRVRRLTGKYIKFTDFKEKLKDTFLGSAAIKKHYAAKVQREIYEGLSLLRNIIASGDGRGANADYVIMRLSERKGVLKKTYYEMLSYMRVNKIKEAEACLAAKCEDAIGKEFAGILTSWDSIDQKMLGEIIISYQKSISEINVTNQKKKDEVISDLIYFPAVANIFIVFVNFIYIGYFSEQKEMLEMIF